MIAEPERISEKSVVELVHIFLFATATLFTEMQMLQNASQAAKGLGAISCIADSDTGYSNTINMAFRIGVVIRSSQVGIGVILGGDTPILPPKEFKTHNKQ